MQANSKKRNTVIYTPRYSLVQRILVVGFAICLIVLAFYSFLSQIPTLQKLNLENRHLQDQLDNALVDYEKVQAQARNTGSEEYIAESARDYLSYTAEDDLLIIYDHK